MSHCHLIWNELPHCHLIWNELLHCHVIWNALSHCYLIWNELSFNMKWIAALPFNMEWIVTLTLTLSFNNKRSRLTSYGVICCAQSDILVPNYGEKKLQNKKDRMVSSWSRRRLKRSEFGRIHTAIFQRNSLKIYLKHQR